MGYIIIIIIALVVLAVISVIFLFLGRDRKRAAQLSDKYKEYAQRQQRAAYATAVVIRAQGGVPADGAEQVRMNLTLDVTSPDGEAYRAHTSWLIDIMALGTLQTGNQIQVKIDADDPKIIYPGAPWAMYTL